MRWEELYAEPDELGVNDDPTAVADSETTDGLPFPKLPNNWESRLV